MADPVIRVGSRGTPSGGLRSSWHFLQEILKSFGFPPYDPGPVDGNFTSQTEVVVRAVQSDYVDFEDNPLVVDGIVGPKAWCALWS